MEYKQGEKYTWAPDAEIKMSGKDFDILYNALQSFVGGTLSPLSIAKTLDAFAIAHKTLIAMVESGVATVQESKKEAIPA